MYLLIGFGMIEGMEMRDLCFGYLCVLAIASASRHTRNFAPWLIRVVLPVILLTLFTVSVSLSDQSVKIEVEDVQKTDEEWHSVLSPDPIEFKYFDAIVQDSSGKQYTMVASIAGNKYRYEAYAWLANPDKWYEIYRATPKVKWDGADVWTEDRRLVYTNDIGTGWQIKARGDEAAFQVSTEPERPISHYSISGSSADFDGYMSFRVKVEGKVIIGNREINVSGLGYCIHTFGDMSDHIKWKYIGFRNEKLCITGMNAQFDRDLMNIS